VLGTDIGMERGDLDIRLGRTGDPEVEDLGLSRRVHEDVLQLEVAVHDALLMGVLDAMADLRHQLETLADVQPALGGMLSRFSPSCC
jgi:hypothetical protein